MFRRITSVVALGMVLAATVVGSGLAGRSAAAAQDGSIDAADSSRLRIVLDCDSSPERTTLTNRSNGDLRIRSLASLEDREAGEPYRVGETLKPGQSITLKSGKGAGDGGGTVVTRNELYTDDSNGDGARVRTSEGTVKERC